MKKIKLLAIVLFASISSFAQISDYNKGKTFIESFGEWNKLADREMIIYNPSPVSYMKIYKETIKVLDFYNIDFNSTEVDNTLLSGDTKIDDYTTMNLDLSIEYASVAKLWVKDNVSIYLICNNKSYSLAIKQK